jgi:hypothetical protein
LAGLRIWIWRIPSTPHAFSGRDGQSDVGRAVRRNYPTVGQELARVVEEDHAVAQEAPPLVGVEGDGVGGVAVGAVSWWARGPVWTHCAPLGVGPRIYDGFSVCLRYLY